MRLNVVRIILLGGFLFCGGLISKAAADDPFEALKLELSLIGSQMEDLRFNLLSPEVRSLAPADAGIALLRLDALEAKLRSTVGRVEALEFHLEILSKDATHRISEFSLKLKELENKKEISNSELSSKRNAPAPVEKKLEELSNETLAFDKALLSYNSRDFASALNHFSSFNETYPQSINVAEAYFWLGQTYVELANDKGAASAFLESFSRAPTGSFAWKSLLGLAIALGELGQFEQGCLTLIELKSRFPKKVSQSLDQVLMAEEQLKCSM